MQYSVFDVDAGGTVVRDNKRDAFLLFIGRCVRMFSYGALTVVLMTYLQGLGLSEGAIGSLLTAILLGDLGVSLWLTSRADQLGRKRCLMVGAFLKVFGGGVFAMVDEKYSWMLFPAGVIGVISSTGGEIGPFLPIEQAALTQAMKHVEPATLFAWYNSLGYISQVAWNIRCSWAFLKLLTMRIRRSEHYAAAGSLPYCNRSGGLITPPFDW